MSWNLPDGCTDADIERAAPGYNEPPDEEPIDEPHASDCAHWCGEACDCCMRFLDRDDLIGEAA